MNAGILAPGYTPPAMPSPLLGQPQPVPMPLPPSRQEVVDPFWNNVVLFLPMDGATGSRNVIDLSNSRRAISAFGGALISNRVQLGSSQTAFFDGSTSYWEETNSALNLPGDFTIEYFFNQTGTNEQYPLGKWGTSGNLAWVTVHNTGSLGLGTASSGTFSATLTFNVPVPLRVWNHVAFTRVGTTVSCFLNGRLVGTTTSSANLTSANTNPLRIGQASSTGFFAGNLAHVRVTRDVARYAANFTPPTPPFPTFAPSPVTRTSDPTDPFWSNVALLLRMDGANNSTTFTDLSLNAFPVTVNSGAKISTAQSQFGGASALFNGSTDFLQIPTSTQFDFPSDFTVEGWFYPQRQDVTSFVVGKWLAAGNVAWVWQYSNPVNSRNLVFAVANNSGTAVAKTFSADLAINTWHYVAFARQSGVLRCFVNGAQVGSGLASTENLIASTAPLQIGQAAGGNYFQGYLDELRITKGIARYTSNFQPTAVPFPSQPSLPTPRRTADPNWNNVSLLIRGNGVNASTAIRDLSNNAFPVTVNGDAKISTTQSQYGGSSVAFDGAGDFLSLGSQSALAYGAGEFTVEMWIRFNSISGQINFFDNRGTSATNNCLVVYILSTLRVFISGIGDVITTTAPAVNQWHHVAVCKSGSTLRLFVNGTQGGSSYTDTTNHTVGASAPFIGASSGGLTPLNGFMQDIRITKGVARYTANFTPPSSLLPEY